MIHGKGLVLIPATIAAALVLLPLSFDSGARAEGPAVPPPLHHSASSENAALPRHDRLADCVMRFRGDQAYPPFEYLDADGEPRGFTVDIVRAVARVMHMEMDLSLGPWNEVRRELVAGEIDALVGLFQSVARDSVADFSTPFLRVSYAVFVREDSDIGSLDDAEGKQILVAHSDLSHDYVLETGMTADLRTYADWQEVLKALSAGAGDCAIVSRLQGMHLIATSDMDNIRPVGGPILQRRYCMAVREGDAELLAALDEGLSIIRTSGEYDRIYESWFGPAPAPAIGWAEVARYVLPLAAVVLVALGWSWSLRRQVRARTLDLEKELLERERAERQNRDLEARLAQSHKMEALGTLSGGIAHDFNNILAAIMGFVQLARDSLPEGGETRGDLDEAMKASRRAADLVGQILAFGRVGGGVSRVVPLQDTVDEVLRLLRSTLPATIDIRRDITDEPLRVVADPGRLHQVLMNLGTNAFHAMQESGGLLTIALRRSGADAGGEAVLTVTDTGMGMSEEVQRRCCEPFYTTKEVGKGTGMGLSVVYGIVSELGGRFNVESRIGEGTSIAVAIPLATEAEVRPEPEPIPVEANGNEHVLVVDDEPSIAHLTARMLQRTGYSATAVTSSTEALTILKGDDGGIDLLITDQTMPGMTGDRLVAAARALRADLPVIICTGHSDRLDAERARDLGAGVLLTKPFDRETLTRAVRATLDRKPV